MTSVSDLLYYGGLIGTGMCLLFAVICFTFFAVTGKRLSARLDEEYGKPDTEKKCKGWRA